LPVPLLMVVGPAIVFTRTVSAPAPELSTVVPACVDSIVKSSAPPPSVMFRVSTRV
jgi:hypothetical protein